MNARPMLTQGEKCMNFSTSVGAGDFAKGVSSCKEQDTALLESSEEAELSRKFKCGFNASESHL